MRLGPLPIRAYAMFIIAGIVAALLIGNRRWIARGGGEPGVVYDVAIWAIPFGLIGGRLYHVITDCRTYFGDDGLGWAATLRIWDGGLGIWARWRSVASAHGSAAGDAAFRCPPSATPLRRALCWPRLLAASATTSTKSSTAGPQTCVGAWRFTTAVSRRASSTCIRSTVCRQVQSAQVVHPTFLYESLWNVVVFGMLSWVDRRFRIGHGRLFALYVAGYCVGRFFVELMRSDAATQIAGIRINSFTATVVLIGALIYFFIASKGREDLAISATGEAEATRDAAVGRDDAAARADSGVDSGDATPADKGLTSGNARTPDNDRNSQSEKPDG